MSTEMQTKVQASPAQNFTPAQTGLLQRKSSLCNTPGLVEDSERDKEKLTLQRSPVDQAEPSAVPPIVHEVLRSPGQPLYPDMRAFIKPRLGHDFSRVSVFVDAPAMIQAKLTISQPDDRYEQEADRVAEQMMQMPEPKVQQGDKYEHEADRVTDQVMGRSAETQRNHPKTMVISPVDVWNRSISVGTEPKEEKERQLPKDSEKYCNRPDEQTGGLNRIIYGGMPLPHQVRANFESRFGHDFGQVKVHHDAYAAQFARRMHAKAFTYQNHIVFGQNQFLPTVRQGKRLIAHELVHVIQQTGRKARSGSTRIMHSSPLGLVQRVAEDWLEANPNPADFSNEELALEIYSIGRWLQDHPEASERQHLLTVLDAFETEATTRADQIGLTDVAEGATTSMATGMMAGEIPAEPVIRPPIERPPITRPPVLRPSVRPPVPGPTTVTTPSSGGATLFGVLGAAVLAFLVVFLYSRESIMSEDEERQLQEEFRRRELERELRTRPGPEVAPRPERPPEPRRRPPSCERNYPDMHECWELDDYIYEGTDLVSARENAFQSLVRDNPESRLDVFNIDAEAEEGPCPYERGGTHTNVRDYNLPHNDDYFGSIVCCPCCLDEAGHPILWARCGFVFH